jgi:Ni/Fe-hydrogenase subunit HybB-like protein
MKMQVAVHPRILRFKPGLLHVILVALMAIGFVVAMVRFVLGIGAITNLSNTYPWGFWISFDIYTGIAISSGAFLLAAACASLISISHAPDAFRPDRADRVS